MNVKLTKLLSQIGCPSCHLTSWRKSLLNLITQNLTKYLKDAVSGCCFTQTEMPNEAVELLGDLSFLNN